MSSQCLIHKSRRRLLPALSARFVPRESPCAHRMLQVYSVTASNSLDGVPFLYKLTRVDPNYFRIWDPKLHFWTTGIHVWKVWGSLIVDWEHTLEYTAVSGSHPSESIVTLCIIMKAHSVGTIHATWLDHGFGWPHNTCSVCICALVHLFFSHPGLLLLHNLLTTTYITTAYYCCKTE